MNNKPLLYHLHTFVLYLTVWHIIMKSCSLCDPAKDRLNDSSDLSYKENETMENFYQKVKIIIMVSVSTVQKTSLKA